MKTAKEMRIDFYGNEDARSFDHDEITLMQKYALQAYGDTLSGALDERIKKFYALMFNSEKYEHLFSIQLHPELKIILKDKEISPEELKQIIEQLRIN